MRGAGLRDDDSIEEVQQVTDRQSIMFFTADGKIYPLKAYQIPEASRTAQGTSFYSVSISLNVVHFRIGDLSIICKSAERQHRCHFSVQKTRPGSSQESTFLLFTVAALGQISSK